MLLYICRCQAPTEKDHEGQSPIVRNFHLRWKASVTSMTERKTSTVMAKRLETTLSKTDSKETKATLPFQLSQNWALLQKSLPQVTTSKKRKRTSRTERPDPPKHKEQKVKPSLSTYNPWRPHAISSRSAGNPLLVQSSADKNIKYILPCNKFDQ